MHAIDAHLVRQVVEVGVVGTGDGQVEIDPAITAAVPVTVLMAVIGQLIEAGVEHPALRRDHAGIETRHSHHRLDGRTRRIEATQHAVVQRLVDGVAQFAIGLETDAGDERVGVETGLADHRQHFAIVRIDGHHSATTPTEGVLGRFLQVDIEAEHDVLARFRIDTIEHTQHATTGIGLDLFIADFAVQLVLVETLDTGLADMVGAGVIGRIQTLELLLVDAPDVADRMREVFLLRIMPHQLRRHLDARQAELVDRNASDLLFGQFEQNRHRLERTPPLAHAALEQGTIILAEFQHLDHRIEHARPVTGAFAGHGQAEAGAVVGDDHAIAVEDQPAGRRDRLHMDAVVLRQGAVMLVLNHLQVVHAHDQHAGQQDDHDAANEHPALDQASVLFMILEANRLRHD